MASNVGICNSALTKLGASRIAVYPDSSTSQGRTISDAFERIRDASIRAHPWGFAIARMQLAADTTAPVFDDANYFTLPSDCLRILPPNDYGLDWKVEGRKIATSYSAPLNLRYLKQVTDPNEMDALFREVFAYNLAIDTCERITQSNTKLQLLMENRNSLISEARRTNAIEQLPAEAPLDDWIAVRDGHIVSAVYYSGGPF